MFEKLFPYQSLIEQRMRGVISSWSEKSPLRDACEYSLTSGGRRFRPAIVMMVAQGIGKNWDVLESALSIELFHTASLVADDLPCMDDDDERRNRPSLHKVFGESIALLSTYALISKGYELLANNAALLIKNHLHTPDIHLRALYAFQCAAKNTGIEGATGGQYLDIFPPNLSKETMEEVIQKKTGALFDAAFRFGWLFGGGELEDIPLVSKAAHHFGMAFQLVDDLEDREQDIRSDNKINLALGLGLEKAYHRVYAEIDEFQKILNHLPIDTQEFQALVKELLLKAEAEV